MILFLEDISQWNGHGILSLMGPTGSGKTSLALNWVREHCPDDLKHPLLVSLDSVAIYQGLDIGSAKVRGSDRSDFDWVGLDLFSPQQRATASDFIRKVETPIRFALQNLRPVIFVGGSHFYERALLEGPAPGEASDSEYQRELSILTNEELSEILYKIDTRFRTKAHPSDRYRLCRFLDLAERQKLSFEELFEAEKDRPFPVPLRRMAVGQDLGVPALRDRLGQRIEEMFEEDWISEVQHLIHEYSPQGVGTLPVPALASVGYQEICDYLQFVRDKTAKISNGANLSALKNLILTRHLQLAKKQRTWIRGLQAKIN